MAELDITIPIRSEIVSQKSWPRRMKARPKIQRAFDRWYRASEARFAIKLEFIRRTDSCLTFGFQGVKRIIDVSLSYDLSVQVTWEDTSWDMLLSLDAFRRAKHQKMLERVGAAGRHIRVILEIIGGVEHWHRRHLAGEPVLQKMRQRQRAALDVVGFAVPGDIEKRAGVAAFEFAEFYVIHSAYQAATCAPNATPQLARSFPTAKNSGN